MMTYLPKTNLRGHLKKVAVIGGGISGLATAYYLRQCNPDLEIQIFESENRCGGLLETVKRPDALMECGPDAIFNEKPWALELCREIGLEPELIPTRSENRRSFILNQGKLCPIPGGFYLTAPRSFKAWLNLPGMSWLGKLRMLGDLFLPARQDNEDESVADFVRRRFGKETLEKLAQPMIAGVYTSRPETLSLLATFPQFRVMEKKYGSIIRALAAQRGTESASGPRYALFSSLKNGMGSLPEKLSELLKEMILSATPAVKIEKESEGWKVLTPWSAYVADALCVAVPSYAAVKLLREDCPELSAQLDEIRYEPVATINFLVSRNVVGNPLEGFGFVVPASERSSLIGCSFSHQKFEGRTVHENHVLLRAFVGGAYGHLVFGQTDEAMVETVFSELKRILNINGEPVETLLRRYPLGMPQYEVGHLKKMETLFGEAEKNPGLFLTGIAYKGIGIPDCVKSAKETAKQISIYFASLKVRG